MLEFGALEAAAFEARPDTVPEAVFALSGEGDLEWIGVTAYADLVESGKGLLGIAAEIRLRSL